MLSNLLLVASTDLVLFIVLPIVGLFIGGFISYLILNNSSKSKLKNAKNEAKKIINDANDEAKTLRKEAVIETKEEQLRLRNEFENESKQKRIELQKTENRLTQKEEFLEKKEANLDDKVNQLEKQKKNLEIQNEISMRDIQEKLNDIEKKYSEIEEKKKEIDLQIEKVANLSKEEAKNILIEQISDEAKQEAAVIVREIEQKAKEDGDKKAKDIISLAISRCAAEVTTESTSTTVEIPNDEVKGRIIGRVGRNIKSFESATGVDVIIDDTPDTVTLSSFDPVRREIARITLEKLIQDGRIHPAKIEEVVERVKLDINKQIKQAGDEALYTLGIIGGMHPELVKLIGKLKYRTSYGQNVLSHSIEVGMIAGLMAQEIGADVKIAKRAGLLHDIGKALDHEYEGTHVQIGVDQAKKYKEKDNVIHCIAAHHNDIQPETIEAVLVQAADAISSSRPGARRESYENYVKRLENIEKIANSFAGVSQSYAVQAGREIRVIVNPTEVDDNKTIFLAKEIAKKLEVELDYPGQIKVNVIREVKSVEYAK
ncbi:MAG: ribonuclease Y [Clostridia bacterium]|nr:ribonuclease Y [Clostridia bacterium]